MRQYLAPSGLTKRCKPPPSESLRGLICPLAFRHFVSVSGMLVSRLGFDKIPTNMPTKRRDVSKRHANVGERLNAADHWKIGKSIVLANEDASLRTLADYQCGGPGRTRTCNQT